MKCKNCGLKLDAIETRCPQCGKEIKRKKRHPILIAGCLLLVIAAGVGITVSALRTREQNRRNNSLIPGIYAGMTKQELYAVLKSDYNPLYNGKVLDNPFAPEGTDPLSYVSYTQYSNVLGLNRPMELEVVYITVGNQQYVESYTLSMPYTIGKDDPTGKNVVDQDIAEKIVPMLENKYGKSDYTSDLYEKAIGNKETVKAELSTTASLLDIENYSVTDFKDYDYTNYCVRITYRGYSSASKKLGF